MSAFDISATAWDKTLVRMKSGILFPGKCSDSSTILVARHTDSEESKFDPFSFLEPFNMLVWVAIALTILFTALVYRLIQQLYDSDFNSDSEHRRLTGVHIFRTSMAAVGHVMFEPTRSGERLLVLSLSFWSLIMVASYTANLAGFLISDRQPVYPATSLSEAQRKGIPICVPKGYSITSKVKAQYQKANLVEVDFNSRYDHLLNDDCSLVADGYDYYQLAAR